MLESVLAAFPLDLLRLTGEEYEKADDKLLLEGERSAFDVVVFDRHSTARLPQGNYIFWGAVPEITGVSAGPMAPAEMVFNWEERHPILRHVGVETMDVVRWLPLKLPPEAVKLVEGETVPIFAYLSRGSSQFLISAFSLTLPDEAGIPRENSKWAASADFIIFMQNAIAFLSGSSGASVSGFSPGQPVSFNLRKPLDSVEVTRPDGSIDTIPTSGGQTAHYGRTQSVGTYRLRAGSEPDRAFAVNLFNETESTVAPASAIQLGAEKVVTATGAVRVSRPAWNVFLMAMLGVLLLEWIVYNRRVFV